ncbi:RidA family protein [Streptomyces sp. NPDC086080]|uniref:RidA family protein n=1 Tax=Streptomyces sp. NPDC086080 TaxID=3365748 RepID=UPI0037CD7702
MEPTQDTSPLTHIGAPDGVAPGTGYTHVVTGTGRLVAVSGQVAFDADGKLVGEGDPAAQARQVFENLRRCLASAGADFGNVVKFTYYVTDVAFLPAVREARDQYIDAGLRCRRPAPRRRCHSAERGRWVVQRGRVSPWWPSRGQAGDRGRKAGSGPGRGPSGGQPEGSPGVGASGCSCEGDTTGHA